MDPASGTQDGGKQGAVPPAAGDGTSPQAGSAPAPASTPLSPISLPPPPQSARITDPKDAPDQSLVPGTADLAASIVDDGDLIEKEWVNRAKHIVATTRNDPYKQSEQMAALRSEYMKQRYGKDVKLSK